MKPIKVVVQGAAGRMGQEVVKALCHEPGVQIVGAVELRVSGDYLRLPDGMSTIPFSSDLGYILTTCQPGVLVDFSTAKATMPAVRVATEKGINIVIGTTGLTDEDIDEIERLAMSHEVGIVVASNFALGAILMMHIAKIAARYFNYAEIIELHHSQKIDAPSGTALTTARVMSHAKGKPFNHTLEEEESSRSRGKCVDGIAIHSVRLPGLMAHQEIIFGGPGQTLNIRHDTINRECYMPGVILAVKKVVERKGLVHGLDKLLGL